MHRGTTLRACTLAATTACACTASATTIGFDGLPGDTIVTTEFQSVGALFIGHAHVFGPAATTNPVSGPNSVGFYDPVSKLNDYTLRIDFVVPNTLTPGTTDFVAFTPTDASNNNSLFELVAFNSSDVQIGFASKVVESTGTYDPQVDTEVSISIAGISYIEMRVSHPLGGNKVIEGDDLRFNAPTPTPGVPVVLAMAGLAVMGRQRR